MPASETDIPLAALAGIIDTMAQKKVLVIGDIMLDRYVYGDVERISPESPVPVLSIKRESIMLGGAGNVLSNLSALGLKAMILGYTGEDENADILAGLVKNAGADPGGLIRDERLCTAVKTRYLAAHQQLLRTDSESSQSCSKESEETLLAKAHDLIPGCAAVILSDYGKNVLSPAVIKDIINKTRSLNIPVLVDPKKTDYSVYKGAHIITPNRKELSEASGGMPTDNDENVTAAARKIIDNAGIETVIATRAQDGMSVISGKGEPDVTHLRTAAREVFDVSGAGDTVIATIAAAIAAGASVTDAAALANIAGGIVVAKVGTAAIMAEDLKQALDTDVKTNYGRQGLICTREKAAEQAKRWQARGLRVGLTNGCFDILHQGHAAYLNAARDKCDRLIVGLNSDESVRRLKGPERPVNDENARAALLAALGAVDMVVIFARDAEEEDKPVKLVEAIQPDIFFKGGDYTIDQLPEAKAVQACGGRIEIMPLIEGASTTGTIKRMKNNAA